MNAKQRKQIDGLLNQAEVRKRYAQQRHLEKVVKSMPTDELREICDLFDDDPDSPRIEEIFKTAERRLKYGNKSIRSKKN